MSRPPTIRLNKSLLTTSVSICSSAASDDDGVEKQIIIMNNPDTLTEPYLEMEKHDDIINNACANDADYDYAMLEDIPLMNDTENSATTFTSSCTTTAT